MFTYSFEKLEVWQDARKLTKTIYNITKNFPEEERFGLVAQLRKSAVSVGSNLAEGASRISMKDQARFSEIAFGSLLELLSQLITSVDLEYLDEDVFGNTRKDIEKIGNKLNSLRKKQLSKSERL